MEQLKIQKSPSMTIDSKRLTNKYKFIKGQQIGSGQSGKVHLAESIADPTFKVAIKAMPKSKVIGQIEQMKEEIQILSQLDHPNIVKYYETYESEGFLYIVMEYCKGNELQFSLFENNQTAFPEEKAALIMK